MHLKKSGHMYHIFKKYTIFRRCFWESCSIHVHEYAYIGVCICMSKPITFQKLDSFHKKVPGSAFKFWKQSNSIYIMTHIRIQICTCDESSTVVTCAKLWFDWFINVVHRSYMYFCTRFGYQLINPLWNVSRGICTEFQNLVFPWCFWESGSIYNKVFAFTFWKPGHQQLCWVYHSPGDWVTKKCLCSLIRIF